MECGYKHCNSITSLERMVRTICFSSLDLSTPQALSCNSKSLYFVKKSWRLSNLFGSNVRNSTLSMCPLISSYFPKIPSKMLQDSMGVLQEDIWKRRSGEIRLQIVLSASSIRFKYLDFSMADVGFVSVFKVKLYNLMVQICILFYPSMQSNYKV